MGSINNDQLQESTSDIPLIDFALFLSTTSTETERLTTAKELVAACHDVGFVSIANHGVPSALLSEAFEWSKRLFDLEIEEKMKAPHPDGTPISLLWMQERMMNYKPYGSTDDSSSPSHCKFDAGIG